MKSKAKKQNGGLKIEMDFDEAMRLVSKIKPERKVSKAGQAAPVGIAMPVAKRKK